MSLVEGASLRGTGRACGVAYNTVLNLQQLAGEVCQAFHDATVQKMQSRYIQCDELWTYCYAKQRNVAQAKSPPLEAGSLWTWTALDKETKLMISYLVTPDRGPSEAFEFMHDLATRTVGRFQITTDGLSSYPEAIGRIFGGRVDYGQAQGATGMKRRMSGHPDMAMVTNAHVERNNLTIRMSNRRYIRRTNGFSKRLFSHRNALALYFLYYNFIRPHKTLGSFDTPAMAAGLAEHPYTMTWIGELIEEYLGQPGPRGPYGRRSN